MTIRRSLSRDEAITVATVTATTSAIVLIRLACQAAALIISIRLLGVDAFGIVAAAVAISLLLGPWSGLGCDFLALRAVARDTSAANHYFRSGVRTIAWTSAVLILSATLLAWLLFRDQFPPLMLTLILVAELFFLRINELIAKILQGSDYLSEMAYTRLMNSLSRLIILGAIALLVPGLSATAWAWVYLIAAALSLCFGVYKLAQIIDIRSPPLPLKVENSHDGLHFAAGITSARLNSEFDKVLVLALAGASSAGIYSAGYRLINLAVAPVVSFVNVIASSLFRAHRRSDRRALGDRSLVLYLIAIAYGSVVGIFLWLFLPSVLSMVFGDDFLPLIDELLALALLPATMSARMVGEQAVAALGRFRLRSTAQWTVATIAVGMNFLLIPVHGWPAAVWVLVVAECALAFCYLGAILSASRIESTK